ncbi:MAG: ribonuclease P protein component [Solirubrobacteraceae bacterium]
MKPRQPRRGRLTRSAEFERVYKRGSSCANRHLVLYSFPTGAPDGPRIGLSVSRRIGGAVERNRVKRVLREAVGEAREQLRDGHDIVVVARPPALGLVEQEGLSGVAGSLRELLERAGVVAGRDQGPAPARRAA